jgi:hypothetical protein
VYGGFFLALFTMSVYEGRTYDKNGYRPFLVRLFGRDRRWDLNVVTFTITTVLLVAAVIGINPNSHIAHR